MKPTIYLVPRWGGKIHSDWYDWFSEEIKERYQLTINILEMPNWHQPDVNESVEFLASQIEHVDKSTYFIGHSVGCQAVLRFLSAKLEADTDLEVGGFLFIAGWFTVDQPWPTITPWVASENLAYDLINEQINYKKVVLSDNDPFTPNYADNQNLWMNRLGCAVSVYPQRSHFNAKVESNLLGEFAEMMQSYTDQN